MERKETLRSDWLQETSSPTVAERLFSELDEIPYVSPGVMLPARLVGPRLANTHIERERTWLVEHCRDRRNLYPYLQGPLRSLETCLAEVEEAFEDPEVWDAEANVLEVLMHLEVEAHHLDHLIDLCTRHPEESASNVVLRQRIQYLHGAGTSRPGYGALCTATATTEQILDALPEGTWRHQLVNELMFGYVAPLTPLSSTVIKHLETPYRASFVDATFIEFSSDAIDETIELLGEDPQLAWTLGGCYLSDEQFARCMANLSSKFLGQPQAHQMVAPLLASRRQRLITLLEMTSDHWWFSGDEALVSELNCLNLCDPTLRQQLLSRFRSSQLGSDLLTEIEDLAKYKRLRPIDTVAHQVASGTSYSDDDFFSWFGDLSPLWYRRKLLDIVPGAASYVLKCGYKRHDSSYVVRRVESA